MPESEPVIKNIKVKLRFFYATNSWREEHQVVFQTVAKLMQTPARHTELAEAEAVLTTRGSHEHAAMKTTFLASSSLSRSLFRLAATVTT